MDATDRLVLFCTTAIDNPNTVEGAYFSSPDAGANIDWYRFLTDIKRHGLLAPAYHLFKRSPDNGILPEEVRQQIHDAYAQELARVLVLAKESEEVLACLSKAKVPVIILKGPYLAEKIYAQAHLRTYHDLDLLVAEQHIKETALILEKIGYQRCAGKDRFGWEQPYPELVFVNTGNGSLCELHWNLLDKTRFLQASDSMNNVVWQKATAIKLDAGPAFAMIPEHILVHLCLHLSVVHRFGKLILYRDISELLSCYQSEIDWDYFVDCIRSWQICSPVYYALSFAKKLINAAVPYPILDQVRPKHVMGRAFEAFFLRRNFVSLPQYAPTDVLWLVLRDRKSERYKAALELPYRAFRWYLKGNTC